MMTGMMPEESPDFRKAPWIHNDPYISILAYLNTDSWKHLGDDRNPRTRNL